MFTRIVKTRNSYFIKRGIIFPTYLDTRAVDFFWWVSKYNVDTRCAFDSFDAAVERFEQYKDYINTKETMVKFLSL